MNRSRREALKAFVFVMAAALAGVVAALTAFGWR